MITLFHNSGALLYCDENGKNMGSTDVFDGVEATRKYFKNIRLSEDFVNQFIRRQKELLISYKLNILQLRIK